MTAMEARLKPWLDVLRGAVKLIEEPDDYNITRGVVLLEWPYELLVIKDDDTGIKETMAKAIEAIELLALLGDSDQALWRRLVTSMWPQAAKRWRDADDNHVFRLGVEVFINEVGMAAKLQERFLLEDVSGAVSSVFGELRDELEAALQDQTVELPNVPISLVIDENVIVKKDTLSIEAFAALLQDVVGAVWPHCERVGGLTGKKKPSTTAKWTELFRVSDAEVVGDDGINSIHIFFYMRQLAALGIRLKHLRLDVTRICEETARIYTPSLVHLLVADETVETKNVTSSWLTPVDSIGMDSYTSPQTYDCIFSALMLSRSIRAVSVGMLDHVLATNGIRPDTRDHFWRWMALVFRGYLKRPLDELRFWAGSLTTKDLVVLEKAMKAEDPFALLFPTASTKRVQDLDATVNASSFYLSIPKARKKTKKARVQSGTVELKAREWWREPLRNLRVIDVEREWLGVLLPGWGKAWVKRADATIVEPPRALEPVHASPVGHFIVEYVTERQKENVLELLRLVGTRINGLTLATEIPSGPPRDHFIRQVLEVCPNLEHLSCNYLSLTSMETIAWSYEEGQCRAKKLTLVIAPGSADAQAVRFFDALADEAHPMALHVRELDITIAPRLHGSLAAILESALGMLVNNQHLYQLSLYVMVNFEKNQVGPVEQALVDEFSNYDDELVAIRLAPLALSSKLAFLSSVNYKINDASRTAVGLPRGVVSLIYQFAAQCRKRRVTAVTKPQQTEFNLMVDSFDDIDNMPCPCCSGGMVRTGPNGDELP